MTIKEAIIDLEAVPIRSNAVDTALRSLRAWESLRDKLEEFKDMHVTKEAFRNACISLIEDCMDEIEWDL